MIKAEK